MIETTPGYRYYRQAFQGRPMPFAFVDLDLFDRNVAEIARRAGGKQVRVASKSIRSLTLIKRVLESAPIFRGVMCYHPLEAVHLSRQGLDDLLIAYPFWHEAQIEAVCDELAAGKQIVAMVDSIAHLDRLAGVAARKRVELPVCLDVDMSTRFPGLHFGVRRSGVATVEEALAIARHARGTPHLRLDGVMGYEAQIAGVQDATPDLVRSAAIRMLKTLSLQDVASRRARVVEAIAAEGPLRFVNGGGTGSLETTREEAAVSELTAGSGFYSPALFDHYQGFRHLPAAGYAIEVTRLPAPGIYTCHGGGYTASGALEKNKQPVPYLPAGAALLELEGAGEVQTPVAYAGAHALTLGDPIFMRHSKAGELCERFNSLLLVSCGKIVGEAATYRGEGLCFV